MMLSTKRVLRAIAIASAMAIVLPAVASAQWYKPWNWRKSEPAPVPAPPRPQVPAVEVPSHPSQQPQMQLAVPQQTAPAVQAPLALTPEQLEERRLLVMRAVQRDASCDSTVGCIKERLDLWQMVQIDDPLNKQAQFNYAKAQRDFDAAKARDDKVAARQAEEDSDRKSRLREAEQYLRAKDFDAAQSIVDDVLRSTPNNLQAQSMRTVIDLKRQARQALMRVGVIGVVALVAIGLLVWLAIVGVRKHRAVKVEEATTATTRAATITVVDGVGRGRSAALTDAIFRIGATPGDDMTRNDLVLSDADARISRFHCNVAKRDGRFFLVDTSTNGTMLNGQPLQRGDPKRIRSGDMLVIADSAVISFTVH